MAIGSGAGRILESDPISGATSVEEGFLGLNPWLLAGGALLGGLQTHEANRQRADAAAKQNRLNAAKAQYGPYIDIAPGELVVPQEQNVLLGAAGGALGGAQFGMGLSDRNLNKQVKQAELRKLNKEAGTSNVWQQMIEKPVNSTVLTPDELELLTGTKGKSYG